MLARPACMSHKSRTPMWRLLTSPRVRCPHTHATSPSEPPQGVPSSTPLGLQCYATLLSHALACMLGGPCSTKRAKSTPLSPWLQGSAHAAAPSPSALKRVLAMRRTLRGLPPPPYDTPRAAVRASHLIRPHDPFQGSVTRYPVHKIRGALQRGGACGPSRPMPN